VSTFSCEGIFQSRNFSRVFFQVATFQMCNLPSGNFPSVQFTKRQLPKSVVAAALGTLPCYSCSIRSPNPSLPQRSAPH